MPNLSSITRIVIAVAIATLAGAAIFFWPSARDVTGQGDKPVCDPTPVATPTDGDLPDYSGCSGARGTSENPDRTTDSQRGPGSWSGIGAEPSSTGTYTLARHLLNCNTAGNDCPTEVGAGAGVWNITGAVSFKEPTRASGTSWGDYHFLNGLHVVKATADSDGDLDEITCPTTASDDNHPDTDLKILYTGPEMLSMGIAHGRFGDTIYRKEIIIQAYYRDPNELDDDDNANVRCKVFPTGAFISDHTAISMGIRSIATTTWRFSAAHHGFSEKTITTQWASATSASYGQEIWARNGDKDAVHAPFNYVDKVLVRPRTTGTLVPWYESVLPTVLQNRSEQIRHDPFVINDAVPGDYTSLSACTIEPGTRLCWAPKAQ